MLTEKKIKATIQAYDMIDENDVILVGLSGGSDSCALMFYLRTHCPNNKIYAAHINHMIRGEAADSDEEFVRCLCDEYNIRLFVEKINVPEIAAQTKKTLEEAARDVRYLFFERICAQLGEAEDKIGKKNIKTATAHNASDNTETVIFNLSRGCGIEGLRGIAPVLGDVIRPLLSCTKEEIVEYCTENNIRYVEDKTNRDEAYTRNFIRHSVAKKLKGRFFKLDENICKMTELVRMDADFIDEYVRDYMRENNITDSADIDLLLDINKVVRSRIIKKMYDNASGLNGGLEYKHVQYVEAIIKKRESKRINLPKNIIAEVSYGRLIFKQPRQSKVEYDQRLESGLNAIPGTDIIVHAEYSDNLYKLDKIEKIDNSLEIVYNLFNHAYIDFDKIIGSIHMRNRHINDEYIFFNQTKSVKKNYVNYKIPVEIRDILPVLYDDAGIIWACGLPLGDRVKVTGGTKNILAVKVYREPR